MRDRSDVDGQESSARMGRSEPVDGPSEGPGEVCSEMVGFGAATDSTQAKRTVGKGPLKGAEDASNDLLGAI